MNILISTGEVSGDVAGALVAEEIRRLRPDAALFGLGGRRLAAAGVEILRETNHLGSVGLTETFGAVPAFAGAFRTIVREVRRRRPEAALLVGNDLFNCLLSRRLRRLGVATYSWFPPQVWLWRSQAKPIAKSYDRIFTSFPEEHEVYSRAGGATRFVGHYLRDLLATASDADRAAARAAFELAEGAPVVAILPGSRTVEIRKLGPVLFAAAARLAARQPRPRFLVPAAEPGYLATLREQLAASGVAGLVDLFVGRGREALAAADVALMASGTASLEAALLGTPMVLTYRISRVTDASVRLLQAVGWIEDEMVGLPNLLLGRRAVPELRQERATAEELAAEVDLLLDDPGRRAAMRADLARIAPRLASEGAAGGVAAAIAEALVVGACEGSPGVAAAAAEPAPRWAAS